MLGSRRRAISTLGAHLSVAVFVLALLFYPLVPAATAPQNQSSTSASKLTFDAASIKEWKKGTHPSGPALAGLRRTPGRISSNCASLKVLVFYAYHLTYAVPLSGLPSWAEAPCGGDSTGTYAFEATMPSETTDDQARIMMQNLLAERFAFQAHWMTRDMPVLALVVRPGGFKLKPLDPTADGSSNSRSRVGCPADDPRCHFIGPGPGSISELASMLSITLGKPVIDKTALQGIYDIAVAWASDASETSSLPSLPTALKEKFNLELKSQIAPVRRLVVDHVEKPTEN
jgi:uncharacterized protein (TIGR03435 family)